MNDPRIIKVSDDITVTFSQLDIRIHSMTMASSISLNPDELVPLTKALQLVHWRLISAESDDPIKSERKTTPGDS